MACCWHIFKKQINVTNWSPEANPDILVNSYDNGNSAIYLGKDSLSSINGAGLIRHPYGKSIPDG